MPPTLDVEAILATGPDLDAAIRANRHLQYYYTFDGLPFFPIHPTTTDFVLDESGKPGNRNLTAVNRNPDGTLFTASEFVIPGTFDNSMQFEFLEYQWTVWGWQLGLIAQHNMPMERTFALGDPVGTASAFMCWLAYEPYNDATDKFTIAPYEKPGPTNPTISTWTFELGAASGAELGFVAPDDISELESAMMYYSLGGTPGTAPFGWTSYPTKFGIHEWVHFTNSVEKTQITPYDLFRRRIYLNGTLHHEISGPLSYVGEYVPGAPLSFGTANEGIRERHGKGMVDQVAYFSTEPDPLASWGVMAT